uniref:Uncharacterized protein n=1 Tax=Setaria italica TaxID=4555 RepID=K3ZJY5_SETIT
MFLNPNKNPLKRHTRAHHAQLKVGENVQELGSKQRTTLRWKLTRRRKEKIIESWQQQRRSQKVSETNKSADEFVDEVGGLLDGGDVLGVVLLDGDLELLLERHDDLHRVQRVGAQVRELGLGRQRRVRAQRQLLLHDVNHLVHRLLLRLHVHRHHYIVQSDSNGTSTGTIVPDFQTKSRDKRCAYAKVLGVTA